MRILYVTFESPLFPAGGIGTYLGYMAKAMQDAGHEIFLFTWTYEKKPEIKNTDPFPLEHVKVLQVDSRNIWESYPYGPYNNAMSNYLSIEIIEFIHENRIEVVEATDFLAPCLAAFQTIQSREIGHKVLCVSYNHGFVEDLYEADQISMPAVTQNENTCDRQQLRLSDIVIAPSLAAKRRLHRHGITENVSLIREPYQFDKNRIPSTVIPHICYMGRLSVSKGIDKTILFANLVDEIIPLQGITLIGPGFDTPFRDGEIQNYIRKRLKRKLSEIVHFAGKMNRIHAMNYLTAGSISPNLAPIDTFSYTCIETIDHGLLPFVCKNSAMAEFFPENWNHCILDERIQLAGDFWEVFETVTANASALICDLQSFNKERLDPGRIADQTSRLFDVATKRKCNFSQFHIGNNANLSDITVLIPAYRPNDMFLATVDSLASQSTGCPKVIIVDDGSPDAEAFWFQYAIARLPRCRVIKQSNIGLLGARNRLIQECSTKLAVFLDIDDILDSFFLEKCLEAYNQSIFAPNAVLTGRKNFEDSNETIVTHFLGDHIHFLRNDYRMTALVETEVLRKIGFDTTRRNGEGDDWIFWLAFNRLGYKAAMLPEPLFYYRFREGSMSWPWSMGQAVGTATMVREEVEHYLTMQPESGSLVARAIYAKATER